MSQDSESDYEVMSSASTEPDSEEEIVSDGAASYSDAGSGNDEESDGETNEADEALSEPTTEEEILTDDEDEEYGAASQEDNSLDTPVGSGSKTPLSKKPAVENKSTKPSRSKAFQVRDKVGPRVKGSKRTLEISSEEDQPKKSNKREPLELDPYPGETTVQRTYLDQAAKIVADEYSTSRFEENLIRSTVNYKLLSSRYYSDLTANAKNISKHLNL